MSQQLANYIRSYRKRANLTQQEMAFLMGCEHATKVSRYELRARNPNLQSAFACQAIFRVPTEELFPEVYVTVEETVISRALELVKALERNGELLPSNQHKIGFLQSLINGEPARKNTKLWENKKNMRFYLP